MSEWIKGVPKEARQVGNVLPTVTDLIVSKTAGFVRSKLLRSKEERPRPNTVQSVTLVGFSALIPDHIKTSGILKDPTRMAVLNDLEQYMVVLNDQIDFEGSGRQDIGDILESLHKCERSRRVKLDRTLTSLPSEKQEWIRSNAEAAIAEVKFVESWIREKQNANNVSFVDTDIYRTTVNGICAVTAAAIIFGPEHLQKRTAPVESPMEIQKLLDKYAWLSGRHPQNEIERAILISHNMTAAMQIVDDRQGVSIDQLLKVPTYAIAALRLSAGDKEYAGALLKSKEEEYKEKALELGAGRITTNAIYAFFSAAQGAHQHLAETGRRNKWARWILKNRHLGLREEVYMKRRI